MNIAKHDGWMKRLHSTHYTVHILHTDMHKNSNKNTNHATMK